MTTATTRTFRNGDGEALPLPKEMAFGEGVDLTLVRSGDVLTVRPARTEPRPSLAEMFAQLKALPGPGEVEVRDTDLLPERPGL